LQYALLYDYGLEAPILSMGERLWVRVSAQVYNDLEDIERFARAIASYP
jgi:isopenicillin-N epimerase